MAVSYPEIGNKVTATIIETQGECTIGMKPGDEFELSTHKCGEFCGLFYHHILGWVQMLQFGGTFPMGDPDMMEWECPNIQHRVKVRLTRSHR